MFYFEGNGGNKGLPARKGTMDEVSRGGDGDDHHQSGTVGASKTFSLLLLLSRLERFQ